MSVVASDIVFYGSANMPENNTDASGGAIDTTTKVVFDDIAATDNVTVISSNAGDTTQTVTITGRDGTGAIVSEALSLNGTIRVVGSQSFERILKIVVDGAHSGTITVTRDNGPTYTSIATLENGILTVRRLFYDSAADAAGGSTRNFYEKIFIKNNNSTTALSNAVVKENSDPTGNITFDLEDAKGDNNSATNRLTAPTGMLGSFDNNDKSVPGSNLGSGEAIGVWLKLALTAGASAAKSTYGLRLTGTTT
jgi:hypothetical protein